jgi:hypothetical protein
MKRSIMRTMAAVGALLLSLTLVGTTAVSARPSAAGHPAFGTVAAANFTGNSLLEFGPGSTGNVAPVTDITGATTGLNGPCGVGFDRRGFLYTANNGTPSITAYAPGATGNVAPALTITGTNTTLNQPIGLAVSPSGDIWVANYGDGKILEFAAGSVGNVAPTRTITGPHTGLSSVAAVALTVDGKGVWATQYAASGSTVEREFSTHANGDATPISTISGPQTQLDFAYGVAAARDGSVVFDNFTTTPAVLSFGPHQRGNATPRTVVSGSNTGMVSPQLIGLNPVGEIWVTDATNKALLRYPSRADGNVAPDHQISGTATQLTDPQGVAVYMLPPSAPRALKKHMHGKTLKLRWHKPASNGGGIEGYLVRHAKHKSGKFHTVKTTTKRHFTKHHAAHGFYDVVAFNQPGYSKHSKRVHVT